VHFCTATNHSLTVVGNLNQSLLKDFKIPILVFFSIIVIVLKLHYEYYHFVYPLVLISLLFFLGVKKERNGFLKSVSILFLCLNLLVLLLPDTLLYKKLFPNWYYWSEDGLSVSHFKGAPINEMDATAAVYPSMIGKFSRVYNYPSSIIFTTDNHKKSWIKSKLFTDRDTTRLNTLLKHEKRHLDLTEVYRRKAMDSINKLTFPSVEEKYLVLEYFYNVSDSINDVFDLETGHGTKRMENKKWEDYIDTELGHK